VLRSFGATQDKKGASVLRYSGATQDKKGMKCTKDNKKWLYFIPAILALCEAELAYHTKNALFLVIKRRLDLFEMG